MQEELKSTPKLGRIRRTHGVATPEIAKKDLSDTTLFNVTTNTTTSRNRTTISGDIKGIQKSMKKKITGNRQSIMPSHSSLDVQKKIDTESKELEFLYNEYLQTMMMDLIIKKKTEEKKHLMVTQLATIVQEIDQDTTKLIKIKKRERDIINLTLAQKEIDEQLVAITKCTKNETFKIVKDTLSKLESLLEPLDVLQCNDIILPKTQDEWKDIHKALTKCSNTLKNITNVIGSKGETYCSVNAGLKDFAETYNEIEDLQQKLEKALCNLQVLTLKNASFSLTHNENQ